MSTTTPILQIRDLSAGYGDFQALFGLDIRLEPGATLAIIGANGAGKSTFLKALTGLVPARRDAIVFDGEPIGGLPAPQIMKRGIAMVPEGRKLFASLSVEENLLIGGWGRRGPKPGAGKPGAGKPGAGRRSAARWTIDAIYGLFPILAERRRSPGTALSGGQQQMVAIGRALISNPSLLLCDEISLGLAPVVIRDIYAALPAIKAEGTSLILVEQDIVRALGVADHVVCFQEGRLTLEGPPADLTHAAIHEAYFGH